MNSIPIAQTTALLGAAGVFTGPWVRVFGVDANDSGLLVAPTTHDKIRCIGHCYSDVISGVNGVAIQQSHDAATIDYQDTFTAAALTDETWNYVLYYKYVRLVYTNGAGAQAAFRLSGRLVEES